MKNKIQINFIIAVFLIALISCSKEDTKEPVIKSQSNDTIQAFTMNSMAVILPVFNEYEPNNIMSQANGLVYQGNRIAGKMNVNGDNDWFKINCNALDTVNFYLDATAMYIGGKIYSQNGTFIKNINYRQMTNYIAPQDGFFYVSIYTGAYAGIIYTLDITNNNTIVESEPNNTLATSNYMYYPMNHFVGVADANNNYDYVYVYLMPGIHTFQLDANDIYCNAQVLDYYGKVIANISEGNHVTLSLLNLVYVRINGYSGIRYKLTLEY